MVNTILRVVIQIMIRNIITAHLKGEHLCVKCMCVLASRSSLLQHQRKSVKCAKLQEMLRLIELEKQMDDQHNI